MQEELNRYCTLLNVYIAQQYFFLSLEKSRMYVSFLHVVLVSRIEINRSHPSLLINAVLSATAGQKRLLKLCLVVKIQECTFEIHIPRNLIMCRNYSYGTIFVGLKRAFYVIVSNLVSFITNLLRCEN